MSETNTPKPRSEKQQEAARRNGALSRGPVTPIGKAISSRNALTTTASVGLVLDNEDPSQYLHLLAAFTAALNPQNPIESAFVQEMAFNKWRQHRAWTTETATLNAEMSRNRDSINNEFVHFHESVRTAHALESSLARTNAIPILNRLETRYHRQFHKALSAFHHQRAQTKSENCKTNPAEFSIISEIEDIPAIFEPGEPGEPTTAAASCEARRQPQNTQNPEEEEDVAFADDAATTTMLQLTLEDDPELRARLVDALAAKSTKLKQESADAHQ